MKPDEEELLERVFSGSREAFAELIERYRSLFYSVFAQPGLGFPRDYLDDLLQSFVVALHARDFYKLRAFEGRNESSLATFLQVVATRFALDERRKFRRHPRAWGEAGREDDDSAREFEDRGPTDPALPSLDREAADLFHNLIFSLDWKRISAVLWVFHGVQRERIAEVMATSRANIDALYKRAKDQMAGMVRDENYSKQPRLPDPAVLTPAVAALLRDFLPLPGDMARETLLVPGAKRRALLGMVLLDYPRFCCTCAELAKLAKVSEAQVQAECLSVLREAAARLPEVAR